MKTKLQYAAGGGFPVEELKFDDLQQSYLLMEKLSRIAGDYVILEGCEEIAPGEISNGTVIINGEIFPFVGGATGTHVIIQSAITNINYQVLGSQPYKTTYTASFGTGVGEIPWASFVAIGSVKSLMASKVDKTVYDPFAATVTTFMGQVDDENVSFVNWTSTPSLAPAVFGTYGWPGVVGTDFRKEVGDNFLTSPSVRKHKTGFIQLRGTFNRNTTDIPTFDADYGYSDGAWYTLLHLPVGYRPIRTVIHVVQPNIWVKIMPTGDVRVYSTLGADFIIFFDSIPVFWGS